MARTYAACTQWLGAKWYRPLLFLIAIDLVLFLLQEYGALPMPTEGGWYP